MVQCQHAHLFPSGSGVVHRPPNHSAAFMMLYKETFKQSARLLSGYPQSRADKLRYLQFHQKAPGAQRQETAVNIEMLSSFHSVL